MARMFWTVVWDYTGGDCGDFPWQFDTEREAEDCGDEWVTETTQSLIVDGELTEQDLAEAMAGALIDGIPVYHTVRHEVHDDGTESVFNEDGDLMYERPLAR